MSIREKAGRIGAGVLAMLQTRLSLAALEIEEESQRLLGYFVIALVALILFGLTLVMIAVTVVLAFWDTAPLLAAGGLALAFGIGCAVAAFKLKSDFANRPRLLGATMDELHKDVNFIRNVRGTHE
ncbi:phage holin family protein [Massilia sp. PAMC28688]|uniref:phage holin family protein n=1 Tax=Massilia sp. PAMC28688 TaxID=2861283 RepID=UPI001C63A8BA|nr:phage holin family protein [Massilia sp. PAMC28688]QYF94432.1 phage holin family protein [Massilia sp. PAMC28688]